MTRSVLVIDDGPSRDELCRALEADGYAVRTAATGDDGFGAAGSARPSAIVAAAAAMARARAEPLGSVPCLVLVHADEEIRALDDGADDVVDVSRGVDLVRARLRTLLRGKAAEAQVADELARKNRELEALVYAVSHDLRAPLRSIDGFSQALIDDCFDKLSEQDKDHLKRVRAAAQRMGELMDGLLALSRVSRADLFRADVDVSALARAVADELHESTPERKGTFVIRPGTVVHADSRLMRVLLENVLGNAWKFTSKVPLAKVEVGVEVVRGEPACFVRDNGAGFDMKHASRLFAPFQRLHGEREFPGTGLGLATVQRIVDRHGGRVWADGELDRGATIFFTVPGPAPGKGGVPR